MSASAPRVALLLATVGDLSGSGGTERQFSDLFEFLRRTTPATIHLVTARAAVRRLRHAGRAGADERIIALPLGAHPGQGKLGIAWMTLLLLWQTLLHRWDVVHICQPTPSYVPYTALLTRWPKALRPNVALTVVDCTLAPNLSAGARPADIYEQQVIDAHAMYFKWARLDGIYSWYQAFAELARTLRLSPGSRIAAAKYCFTDPQRFQPGEKRPLVIYAGRLSNQKRPLLFVDAVARLHRDHPAQAAGWQFAMYGAGPLEAAVRARIAGHGLTDRLSLTSTPDMAPVFAASRLFVSTQAHENFTSLAMLEAMAAGNAVIAERVGQSGEFVKARDNGYLVSPATPEAFADAMADYIGSPAAHDRMAAASRALAVDVHNIEHFAADIAAFWQSLR